VIQPDADLVDTQVIRGGSNSPYSEQMAVEPTISSGSMPAPVMRTAPSGRTSRPGRSDKIGRDPLPDTAIDDPRVAWASAPTSVLAGGAAIAGLVTAGHAAEAAASWERGGRASRELLSSAARG
jgi:hypothetical protein